MNFLEAQREFRRRCMAANLSMESINQYEKVLKRFVAICVEEKLGDSAETIPIERITPSVVRYYLSVRSQEVAGTTVRIHYMALHTFFSFLYKEEIMTSNIMDKVEKPKKVITEIPAFTKEDIARIMETFDKESFVGFRNYALTCLLFGTGLRRSEATKLKIADIVFGINAIKVVGKGNKFRLVPMGEVLRRTLQKYIRIRDKHIKDAGIKDSPYVFFNSRTGLSLRPNAISDIYRDIAKKLNIKGVRVSPHTFRHSFAKYYLINGGDVFSLQKTLGHGDIAVTKKYISLNDEDIRRQNDKFNPLENDSWRYTT